MAIVAYLSELLGASEDHIRTFIQIVLSYPASFLFTCLFKRDKSPTTITSPLSPTTTTATTSTPSTTKDLSNYVIQQYLYLIGVGSLSLYYVFGLSGIQQVIWMSLPIYILLKIMENEREEQRKNSTYTATFLVKYFSPLTFVWTLGQVAILHYRRWLKDDAETMDSAVVAMLLTVKLTHLVHFQVDSQQSITFEEASTTQQHQQPALKPVGVLEYLAYIFLYIGIATGPITTFPEFRQFISITSIPVALRRHQSHETVKSGLLGLSLLIAWPFIRPHLNEQIYMAYYLDSPFYFKYSFR
jgi:hypothetical protein